MCADFDDEAVVFPAPFGNSDILPGVTMTPSTSRSTSPPRSLFLKTTASAAKGFVSQTFAGMTSVEIAFDVFLEVRGTNLTLAWIPGAQAGDVYVQPVDDTTTRLTGYHEENGSGLYQSTTGGPVDLGRWTHVSLAIDFPTHAAVLKNDGVATARTLVAAWANAPVCEVFLGAPATTGTTLSFDNVTITKR